MAEALTPKVQKRGTFRVRSTGARVRKREPMLAVGALRGSSIQPLGSARRKLAAKTSRRSIAAANLLVRYIAPRYIAQNRRGAARDQPANWIATQRDRCHSPRHF